MNYYDTANAATLNQYFVIQELIEHAEPILAVSKFGKTKPLPQNKTDTILFSRVLPLGYDSTTGGINVTPTSYQLSEGSNPTPVTIQYQDLTVSLAKYGVYYKTSEKTELMNERNIPEDMRATAAEGVGSIKEMIVWNQIKGGTSVTYTNGSTRAGINTPISLNALEKAKASINDAHGSNVVSAMKSGPDYGNVAVGRSLLVYGHTQAEHDYRALAGFKDVVDYGSAKPYHDMEIGSVPGYRIILTPMLKPWTGAGSTTINGMQYTGSNVDVYPSIVVAANAYGHVPLKGRDAMTPFVIPASQRNHANFAAQFGYVGVDFYTACIRLNEFWLNRIEHAVTSL
ncbi:MAG: N4-gp56 family major capsid protein [Betaproteobacteria bacterium]|nr:N4-gp56 family major capsid protein [Betaproteobacteria bacterium]